MNNFFIQLKIEECRIKQCRNWDAIECNGNHVYVGPTKVTLMAARKNLDYSTSTNRRQDVVAKT